MTRLSRRAFLTLSGTTLLAASLPFPLQQESFAGPETLVGRALRAVPIRRWRTATAAVVRTLWPDEVTSILDRAGQWYGVPGGFVPVEAFQPMLPYDPVLAEFAEAFPAWIGVIAPAAPVRTWASSEAPLVTRIGCGGVLCGVDSLRNDRGDLWYAVSASPGGYMLGWTPAIRWSVAVDAVPDPLGAARYVRLDSQRAELSAWEDDREVLRIPAAVPATVRRGAWSVTGRQPGAEGEVEGQLGAAWELRGEGASIYGVHWHNTFGSAGNSSGWELPAVAARWLYGWLPDGAVVEVV